MWLHSETCRDGSARARRRGPGHVAARPGGSRGRPPAAGSSPARRPATGSSWPSISALTAPASELRLQTQLDHAAGQGGRQRLPVWRNRNRRKTDFAILPLQRLRSASENACTRLPPPNRNQIEVNIMSSSNLDHTGPRRQTLLDNPKLLGNRPPQPPLRAGQNRNRRQRLLICLQINEQTISR